MSDARRLVDPITAILLRAVHILETRGWCQHAGETPDGRVCPARALELAGDVCGHAFNALSGYLRTGIARWNDTPGRTLADVLTAMRGAAAITTSQFDKPGRLTWT